MEGFLLFVVLAVLLIRWRVLSRRYAAMEQRIEAIVSRDPVDASSVAQLVRRVYQLELAVAGLKDEYRRPAPVPSPVPMTVTPDAAPPLEPVEAPAPRPQTASVPAIAPRAAGVEFGAAARHVGDLPHAGRSSEDWEALVGGDWLNKLGILILVIAIALFLGYSFTQVGPGGRAVIGLAVSVSMLAGGVMLERRARYVTFGRGLLSGGWAGLYFTTYAMQAVDAAKIIHNPLLGGTLLLAVATGMVAHSLRYRVQSVTGLAYFVAFATLAITPVTAFSVIALVPLTGSLLVIAYRFSWPEMVLFGLIATYATCASRGDSGAPLWSAQAVFAAYWLLFEAYDILRARRRSARPAELPILALNAIGFGALSYAKWSAAAPEQIYLLSSGVAAAYLASTILRAILRPPSSFPAEHTTMDRIFAGAYEGPITLAAAFSAAAASLKLHGQTVNVVLLGEGELLFLAGLLFRQNYPRRLAGAVFGALGLKLVSTDTLEGGMVRIDNLQLWAWTPTAAFAAALFYLNRALHKNGRTYGYAASALIALILGNEISWLHLGIVWLGLGVLLFVFGWQFRLFDFRMQGYLAGALALGAMCLQQIQLGMGTASPWTHSWIPLAAAAVAGYGAALCALSSAGDRLSARERRALQAVAGAAASAAAAALLWRTVPEAWLAPAWALFALVLLVAGRQSGTADLRFQSYAVAALAFCRALDLELQSPEIFSSAAQRILAGGLVTSCLFAAQLFHPQTQRARLFFSLLATTLATAILYHEVTGSMLTVAWAMEGAVLLAAGFPLRDRTMRISGLALFLVCIAKLFFYDLRQLETLYRILSFFALGVILLSVSWVYTRFRDRIQRYL